MLIVLRSAASRTANALDAWASAFPSSAFFVRTTDTAFNIVRATAARSCANDTVGAKHFASHCSRRSEEWNVPAGSTSSDAFTSLPKRQPGREAGTQSNGSRRDGRATEEAPSADEPRVATKFGEEEAV